ncbi:bifunctional pyr operon transcriptional regulator/uracil phosphoribosyltransferase PyrR [Tessaracoccus flavus]|uniref:Bifunctional protein PyrR n=1 Tax=Tessaracoccus flavus TaxID=1610493 RepID=A0A1Q2CFR1_9ACTN|nr:bifunctional pyr operon transcriptional regulator/uracil phosphoribosyltransferase PyrR [Tessaracoccus flavus]AQP44900.1 bifunctional pyr operon transcriptional regulator/uracil phosphoribosyltransferase [Tessaracoccus flavus]SDY98272.1 pyrimidine operon attenuation protein / uracil phosphoribosyltransferase [Tessaracoccus flavus]
MDEPRAVMTADDISRALTRMTHEIVERNRGAEGVLLLGILTRGVPLAHRIAEIAAHSELTLPVGQLDITMYRDDLRANPTRPVGRTILPGSIDDRVVVLVDDVLYSGRTVQAALHALADLGRPSSIQLVTLIDRGLRELPIQADVVGKSLPSARSERVRVQLSETDGEDLVTIERTAQ